MNLTEKKFFFVNVVDIIFYPQLDCSTDKSGPLWRGTFSSNTVSHHILVQHIRPESFREPRNKVGSISPTKHQNAVWTKNFPVLTKPPNRLCYSLLSFWQKKGKKRDREREISYFNHFFLNYYDFLHKAANLFSIFKKVIFTTHFMLSFSGENKFQFDALWRKTSGSISSFSTSQRKFFKISSQ